MNSMRRIAMQGKLTEAAKCLAITMSQTYEDIVGKPARLDGMEEALRVAAEEIWWAFLKSAPISTGTVNG